MFGHKSSAGTRDWAGRVSCSQDWLPDSHLFKPAACRHLTTRTPPPREATPSPGYGDPLPSFPQTVSKSLTDRAHATVQGSVKQSHKRRSDRKRKSRAASHLSPNLLFPGDLASAPWADGGRRPSLSAPRRVGGERGFLPGGRPCLCSRLASHFRESGMRPLPGDMQLCCYSASSEWKLSNMVHTYSADCQDQSFRWLLQSFGQPADPGFVSLGHPSSIC